MAGKQKGVEIPDSFNQSLKVKVKLRRYKESNKQVNELDQFWCL